MAASRSRQLTSQATRPGEAEVHRTHTSTTLDDLDSYGWANSTLVTGDLADALTGLKRQPGGDIVCWAAPYS